MQLVQSIGMEREEDAQEKETKEEEEPKMKPGIPYPNGVKAIEEVDKELEQHRKDNP